jgi:outer membrane biosynthesis protein TonB
MKRCPQCEFIYEDDQSLCDMDGVLLVLDTRKLPNLHALTTVPVKARQRRNRAVPAFATLILALVLGTVYYVSTRRNTLPTAEAPASITSTSNPGPEANPTPKAQPSEESKHAQPVESKQPPPVEAKPAPAKKPAVKTSSVSVSQPKPSPEPKKDESKVGSLLKKTGRILKKPFKF